MTTTETWTIGRLLTWTTEYLKKSGSESARLDAEILLAHARECERIQLYTAFEEEPSEETKTAFREMVKRRSEGTPVAYLVGYKEFYSASFEVNPDVLIPRAETEHLIVEALDRAKDILNQRGDDDGCLRILDVGTGSGIVAITLAKHLPNCNVTAVDLSTTALEVAKRNVDSHQISLERIELLESDLLSNCEPDGQFDLIVSNPPYVSQAEFESLEATVRDFEPKQALVAGTEGSEIIVRLLQEAQGRLADDGFVLVEFSPMLAERIDDWLPSTEIGKWSVEEITKDLAGMARIVTLRFVKN